MAGSPNTLTTNDGNFDSEVMKSAQLALVDFWAEWCGPCKMLAPTLDQIADQYQGKVRVYKMNVDENPNTPSRFHIRGIPTLLLFKDGKLVDQLVGNQPKDLITQAIDKHL